MARPAPHPRKYEMMIVVAPTVAEDGLPNVVERVTGYVETHGGTIESVTHDSPWGRRRLAYPIQNFRDAFYVLYYFHIEPRAIDEIDREIRLDDAVIRHLIVRYDPLTERIDGIHQGDESDDDEREEAPRPRPAPAAAPVAEAADDDNSSSDDDDDDDNGASDDDDDNNDNDDDNDEDDSDDGEDEDDEEDA